MSHGARKGWKTNSWSCAQEAWVGLVAVKGCRKIGKNGLHWEDRDE